ncbi:hypothetical protein [Rhodococcus sp. WAY2]|uniref:hypothetical protein n=1 Tax=Rhodococcus sp. WAY2 TaxID=2663121 RepID=UPI00132029A4|nr:hypothetical protein [Rhodococcus sp. WAY2]QHE69823.1 hypothetical protein GFS60_03393 [Rhodococcus sp. WAY2]
MLNRLYTALLTAAGLSCDGYITLDEAVSSSGHPPRTGTDSPTGPQPEVVNTASN